MHARGIGLSLAVMTALSCGQGDASRTAPENTRRDAISQAARQVAHTAGGVAIVTYTSSGSTALYLARQAVEAGHGDAALQVVRGAEQQVHQRGVAALLHGERVPFEHLDEIAEMAEVLHAYFSFWNRSSIFWVVKGLTM